METEAASTGRTAPDVSAKAVNTDMQTRVPTVWTRRLQWLVAVFSVLATSGTAMVLGHVTPEVLLARTAMPPAEIGGFLTGFRIVGVIFLAANTVGLLSFRGKAWVYYFVLVLNLIQGVGFFYVDVDAMGLRGLGAIGSVVTDGGGGVIAIIMLGFLVRYRTAWAHRRVPDHGRSTQPCPGVATTNRDD